MSIFGRLHLAAFLIALSLWTVALWMPAPTESANKALGDPWYTFLLGKTLHVTAYAFLTILGGTAMRRFGRWQWLPFMLVGHGIVTELVQLYVGRTGRVKDVLLDTLGIAIGTCVVWCVSRSKREKE